MKSVYSIRYTRLFHLLYVHTYNSAGIKLPTYLYILMTNTVDTEWERERKREYGGRPNKSLSLSPFSSLPSFAEHNVHQFLLPGLWKGRKSISISDSHFIFLFPPDFFSFFRSISHILSLSLISLSLSPSLLFLSLLSLISPSIYLGNEKGYSKHNTIRKGMEWNELFFEQQLCQIIPFWGDRCLRVKCQARKETVTHSFLDEKTHFNYSYNSFIVIRTPSFSFIMRISWPLMNGILKVVSKSWFWERRKMPNHSVYVDVYDEKSSFTLFSSLVFIYFLPSFFSHSPATTFQVTWVRLQHDGSRMPRPHVDFSNLVLSFSSSLKKYEFC